MIPAAPAYAAALAEIHALAFPDDPWDAGFFKTMLEDPLITGFIHPAGGMVLFRVVADEAEIITIGVTAPRRGVGRGLMAAAMNEARRRGAAAIHLEVAAGNVPALGLYDALGFARAGLRTAYYADGTDALILSKTLGDGI